VREAPFLDLAEESLNRFPSFSHALQEQSGIDVEFRTAGKLHVASEGEEAELHALATDGAAARFDASLLDGDEARRLEPALSRTVTTAVLVGRDYRVNNRLLAQSLLASAVAAGVRFRTANPVAALAARAGTVTGVRLASGELLDAAHVVLAAGAWSGQLEGLPAAVPVRPIKGQMFAVDSRVRSPGRDGAAILERVVFASGCYIIPREDGRLLVGATVEDVGFVKGPTPRGIAGLMHAAIDVVPVIADLPLVETWAGFRPGTPDHLPILGTDPDMRGLIHATGHYRNGILLAPSPHSAWRTWSRTAALRWTSSPSASRGSATDAPPVRGMREADGRLRRAGWRRGPGRAEREHEPPTEPGPRTIRARQRGPAAVRPVRRAHARVALPHHLHVLWIPAGLLGPLTTRVSAGGPPPASAQASPTNLRYASTMTPPQMCATAAPMARNVPSGR
jgi:glycine oxidase